MFGAGDERRRAGAGMTLRSTINWLITLVMVLFIFSLTAIQITAARRSIDADQQVARFQAEACKFAPSGARMELEPHDQFVLKLRSGDGRNDLVQYRKW